MLKGFCHPFTPGGNSQLVGPPPWRFSVEQMVIDYHADESQVKSYIPDPLEPSSDSPNGCAVRITSMTSLSDNQPEMMALNPERSIFNEAILYSNCSYKGTEGQKISYMWVDNDFTMFRGWLMGTPKKLGRIRTNFERRDCYGVNPALGEFGTGTKLKGWAEAYGERLVTAGMTLGDKITPEQLPKSIKREIYNIVHFPNIEIGAAKPLAHRLTTVVAEAKIKEMWEGLDATLVFSDSEIEEHTDLKPIHIANACYMSLELTIHGTKLLHDYNE
jgi:acetoacetate decarboxylase